MIRSGFNIFNQEIEMAVENPRKHPPPASDEQSPAKRTKLLVLKMPIRSTDQATKTDAGLAKAADTGMVDQNASSSDSVSTETVGSAPTSTAAAESWSECRETFFSFDQDLVSAMSSLVKISEPLTQLQGQMVTNFKVAQAQQIVLDDLRASNADLVSRLQNAASEQEAAVAKEVADLKAQLAKQRTEADERLMKANKRSTDSSELVIRLRRERNQLQRDAKRDTATIKRLSQELGDLRQSVEKLKKDSEQHKALAAKAMEIAEAKDYEETGRAIDNIKKVVASYK